MIAGAICEETDCTGLVWLLLGALAALVAIVVVVSVALMAAVSAILERRGWPPRGRRTAAAVCVVGAGLLLAIAAPVRSDIVAVIAWVVGLVSIPVAIWQRWITRRWRGAMPQAQSSPCSTA